MSIDRVATSNQSAYMTSRLLKAEAQVSKYATQVASEQVSTNYTGYGDKVSSLESARAVVNRTAAYQTATKMAITQTAMQDDYLEQLSTLAADLKDALGNAVSTGDGSSLSTNVSGIFDHVVAILNAQDSSGNYIFGGGNNDEAPFSVTDFSDLTSLASAAEGFTNGTMVKSVQISDSETLDIGMLASDIGGDLMTTLKSISDYIDANGDFTDTLTSAQSDFLSSAITSTSAAYKAINHQSALNGNVESRLANAKDSQDSMLTLYKGFVSDIEDVDMGEAANNLTLARTALQAVVQVTTSLNDISLLNYLR